MNPFSSLKGLLTSSHILVFAVIYALLFLSGNVHPSIWTLYTEHRFAWNSFQVGLSLCFVGLVYGMSQGVFTKKLTPIWGEEKSLLVGVTFNVIGFFLYAVIDHGWMMYGVMIVSSLSGLSMPSLQSIMTKACPPDRQGELQGSLVSLASLSSIAAPLIYTRVFQYGISPGVPHWFVGAPYYLASLISLICLIILFLKLSLRKVKNA